MTIYRNVGGTSKQNCSCTVKFTPNGEKKKWIAHYIIETKQKVGKCSMIRRKTGEGWSNCNNNATLGAHIRLAGRHTSNNQYIVPACASCNNYAPANIEFKLKKGVKKIRALAANCNGTVTVSFSANSGQARKRNSKNKRTCKKWGCNTCPKGKKQFCSVHKPKKKKSCKKHGCKVTPMGRRLYCSSHRP